MSRVMKRTRQIRKPKTRRDGDTYAVTASFCTVHALVGTNGTSRPLSFPASQLRFTWQGREYNRATALYSFRARWYDPAAGRWLSKDPIGLEGGLNLYEAFGNNPVCFRDPEGLSTVRITTPSEVVVLVDPSITDFCNAIKSQAPDSITALEIVGHGNNEAIAIEPNSKTGHGLVYLSDITSRKKVFMTHNDKSFSDFIQEKLAPGATIDLNGCSTGATDDNITRQLSRELSGVTLIGNRNDIYSNEILNPFSGGVFFRIGKESHSFLRSQRRYLNGDEK